MKWANAANLKVTCPLGFKYLRISKAGPGRPGLKINRQSSDSEVFGFCIMAATITSNSNLMPPLK